MCKEYTWSSRTCPSAGLQTSLCRSEDGFGFKLRQDSVLSGRASLVVPFDASCKKKLSGF